MSLLTRFDDAIRSFSQQTAQQNGGAKGPGNAEVDSVLVVLDPLMKQATQEFRAIRLGETSVPNAAVFLLDSESVLMKSMLIFEQGTGKFFRRDELDLNLPDVIFELADQTRQENIEVHNFSYQTAAEAVEAYLQWLAWALALLRKERDAMAATGGHNA